MFNQKHVCFGRCELLSATSENEMVEGCGERCGERCGEHLIVYLF